MKAAALRGALSDRARENRVHVVSGVVEGDNPTTKAAATMLATISDRPNLLLVVTREDELTWLSVRNLVNVHVVAPDQLNTYDVLVSDDVVFTSAAFEEFISGPARGRGAKAVATESEAASVEVSA
jgi:large subunit ribosomal protein L4